ncbi:hypothetical protein AB0D78_37505 [Streptomyces avermitilis]|uniref:hypothetical protein n=1 Tax=Streptomyces avermitilis TaxID=33903 RepID=UPI0034033438
MALVTHTHSAGAADEPLLSYEVTTSPDPLKVSPEDPQTPEADGELVIVGSRRDRIPADLESIKVKIPAGAMSPDLATDLSKATARISLDNWTARLNSATDEFEFTPTASHTPIGPDTGFTIQISQIPINREVGTSPITINESSRTGNSAFQPRSTVFNVGKFPADFHMGNLICTPLVIDNGGQTTLTWESSPNATYELLYGDTNLNVTNVTTRTVTNIKSDTTFYLRGTAGDPSNPVVRILSSQVTVRLPDLEVTNLTVRGSTAVGNLTAKGDTALHNLTAEGPTTLNNLNAKGVTDFHSLTIGIMQIFGQTRVLCDAPDLGHDSPFSQTYEFDTDGLIVMDMEVTSLVPAGLNNSGLEMRIITPAAEIKQLLRPGLRPGGAPSDSETEVEKTWNRVKKTFIYPVKKMAKTTVMSRGTDPMIRWQGQILWIPLGADGSFKMIPSAMDDDTAGNE